ncbi:FAD-dependent monooxygenase [Streptomyces sp. NPDC052396]|uniref:FAD-dependent monooxygenase n=1 Tax=Streptomyces sp. NPDC052396 TaxID=3365689 RepID=UPI0037D58FC8
MTASGEERDVVIVGGGPTGLLLGIALRGYGLDTLVVDREPGGKREARACVVWQRALEGLRDLGCAESFLAEGLPLARAEFHLRGRLVAGQRMGMADTAFPGPLSIEQDAIERLLGERIRQLGPDVRWSTEVVAVRAGRDGAEVRLRGADGRIRAVGCRWVVGCDGTRSIVRRSLGIPFEGRRRTDLQCLQMNAEPGWRYPYAPDLTRIFVNHRVSLIVSPVPGGGYRFFGFLPDPEPRLDAPPSVAEMRALVAEAVGEDGIRLVPTVPFWANRARFQDRVAAGLRQGSALLAGDSAHAWAPIGGHGLNTGLRGAHNLGWKLAAVHHGWAPEALLDTYSTEQRRTARQMIREMRRNVLELPPGRAMLAALRVLVPLAARSARGRALLSDFTKNHRGSALSVDAGGRGALRAGDRMPDLRVEQGQRPVRLHELLSYRGWTLLVDPGAREAALRRIVGRCGAPVAVHAVRADALPRGTLYLVRPDGHIGLRAAAGDHRALEGYLRRWWVMAG